MLAYPTDARHPAARTRGTGGPLVGLLRRCQGTLQDDDGRRFQVFTGVPGRAEVLRPDGALVAGGSEAAQNVREIEVPGTEEDFLGRRPATPHVTHLRVVHLAAERVYEGRNVTAHDMHSGAEAHAVVRTRYRREQADNVLVRVQEIRSAPRVRMVGAVIGHGHAIARSAAPRNVSGRQRQIA